MTKVLFRTTSISPATCNRAHKSIPTAYCGAEHTANFFRPTKWSETHDAIVHESEPKTYESRKKQPSIPINVNCDPSFGNLYPTRV